MTDYMGSSNVAPISQEFEVSTVSSCSGGIIIERGSLEKGLKYFFINNKNKEFELELYQNRIQDFML